jgi:hypothetical protein
MFPSCRPQLPFYPPIAGERGYHSLWGSRCYDYAHRETLRLLLSNIQWWLTEYNIDGFRWDGVSSMVFKNHAIGRLFKCVRLDYRRAMRSKKEHSIISNCVHFILRLDSSFFCYMLPCMSCPGFCKRASLCSAARHLAVPVEPGPGLLYKGTYDDYFLDCFSGARMMTTSRTTRTLMPSCTSCWLTSWPHRCIQMSY